MLVHKLLLTTAVAHRDYETVMCGDSTDQTYAVHQVDVTALARLNEVVQEFFLKGLGFVSHDFRVLMLMGLGWLVC